MRPKASYNARPGKQHQFIMDKDHMTLRCYMWAQGGIFLFFNIQINMDQIHWSAEGEKGT